MYMTHQKGTGFFITAILLTSSFMHFPHQVYSVQIFSLSNTKQGVCIRLKNNFPTVFAFFAPTIFRHERNLSSQEQCIIVKNRSFFSPNNSSPGWIAAGQPRSCCLQHLSVGPYAPRCSKLFALHPPPHQFVPGIRIAVVPSDLFILCTEIPWLKLWLLVSFFLIKCEPIFSVPLKWLMGITSTAAIRNNKITFQAVWWWFLVRIFCIRDILAFW